MRVGLGRALCLCLLMTACSALAGQPDDVPERAAHGPLRFMEGTNTWYYEARQGAVFSDGLQILRVAGHSPATIESVEVEGGDKSLAFLGARLGLPGRSFDFYEVMPGFPSKKLAAHLQVPAEGATLQPGAAGYMLMLGYQVANAAVMDKRTSIIVDYSVASRHYRATLPAQLITCPPPLTDSACSEKYAP